MKFVCTSDTHYPFGPQPDGDVLIHAGDLMYNGGPDEWYSRLKSLEEQPHKIKFFLPGNHDFHPFLYAGVAVAELRRVGVTHIGTNAFRFMQMNGIKIMALPFVTGLPGWAFNVGEEWLDEMLSELDFEPDIVITHAPPYRILDDVRADRTGGGGLPLPPENVGCLAYNRWFHRQKYKPKFWVCGHIHESYGETTVDGCRFMNVAMCNRNYEQVNPAITFEFEPSPIIIP